MTERQYIRFDLIEEKSKTNVYEVVNITHEYPLGVIKWYTPWRRYCFFTTEGELILSVGCMKQVSAFITVLMEDRKK